MEYSEEKCAVCSITSNCIRCESCRKIYYCSPAHQKDHLAVHSEECFPAVITQDEINGRYLISTRDIEEGSLIMREKAMVAGPSRNECSYPICLACHRSLDFDGGENSDRCPNCSWPLCSKTRVACKPKYSHHTSQECQIFSSNHVPPVSKSHEYDFIKFLRTLLLSQSHPDLWDRVTQLESHCKERASRPKETNITLATCRFLRNSCNLPQFDLETINFVIGANRVNSFNGNVELEDGGSRCVSLLFYYASFLNHSCVPNTRTFIVEKNGSYSMEVRAAIKILQGQHITQQYVSITNGTLGRRGALEEGYYFSCACPRCSDPTELGTHLSTLKCPDCESPNANLLPIDSLDAASDWKCTECSESFDHEFISSVLDQVREKISSADSTDDSVDNIDALIEVLEDSQAVLHKNHYILMNLEYEIVQRFIYVQDDFPWSHNRIEKMLSYIQHCLSLANVIRPGTNNYRGGLLYYLARCYYLLLNIGTKKEKDLILEKLRKAVKEAYEILKSEPKGSQRSEMAQQLSEFLNI